ncbi:Ribosomal large subunit pseudouridine synthase D [Anaplasma phagocytophilum]|uniref:Pseudouridine synthase n=1 Tax=Anaplasma phagocytophilum TaxID=948 RepID=A0AA45ZH45_ANAPH|nr:RluA family pseudouridine synthase [Anaplasma phagocytophilum]SBO13917.1 Ribosomal large subunit pseudouridine synthase D [Anaplasma phagocytophilum]SCV62427.1 Ribosomal large subunit pseudouridine synthase D [Anaplasma phagocytophilum]SCV62715.1 Ribosomal large subunit pseudouridine synthase D [Anaplasma phagocytophilum]
MAHVHTILIEHYNAKKRLDVLISASLDISRSKAQCIISDGGVTLLDTPVLSNSHLTKTGDVYTVTVPDTPQSTSIDPNHDIPLHIIHEDEHIIVIDKAPNIAVHPGHGTKNDTLAHALLAHCGNALCAVGNSHRPGIIHRLDKDTSGLMVIAKTEKAYLVLSQALEEKKFRKEYLALIWGIPTTKHCFIQTNLDVKRSDKTMMEVTLSRGKHANTEYIIEKTFGNVASLARCILHTGRTHQIRVHMSHIGHSVVGDQKYGKNNKKSLRCGIPEVRNFKRQALHACLLCFHHPCTGEYLCFNSNPAKDIQELISILEKATSTAST